jgi:hypothetical protein
MKNLAPFLFLILFIFSVSCSDDEEKTSGTITVDGESFPIKEGYYSIEEYPDNDEIFYENSIILISKGLNVIKEDGVIDDVEGKGAVVIISFEGDNSERISEGVLDENLVLTLVGPSNGFQGHEALFTDLEVKRSGSRYTITNSFTTDEDVRVSIKFSGKLNKVKVENN